MYKMVELFTDGCGNFEVVFETPAGKNVSKCFVRDSVVPKSDFTHFIGLARGLRMKNPEKYKLNINDFFGVSPTASFIMNGDLHNDKGCIEVNGQNVHEYSERTCPKCGAVFCYSCCHATNVHEGGKYEDDYMHCPCCFHDVFRDVCSE